MFKGVIFDLDGTLVDTFEDIAHAMNRALGHYQLPTLPIEQFRHYIGGGSKCMVQTLTPPDIEWEEVYDTFMHYYDQQILCHSKLYPGVATLLQQLKQAKLKIMVLTNKQHEQAMTLLSHLFPQGIFDGVQGLSGNLAPKPDPSSTLSLLQRANLTADECVFVGDTGTDITTAECAGIPSVFVSWGYGNKPSSQAGSFTTASSVQQLEKYLFKEISQ